MPLGRLRVLLACIILAVVAFAAVAAHPADAETTPEQQLAETYSPIAYYAPLEDICLTNGEAFRPAPVDVLWNRDGVLLRSTAKGAQKDDPVIAERPSAQQVGASNSTTDYIELPGDPLDPGCTYRRDWQQIEQETGVEPSTITHIVVDEANHKVVVEYWFWYWFNEWNDNHESDWEMIMVVFDAGSVEEALQVEPEYTGYAQHTGGELAAWNDSQLQKEGTHPLVFPSVGSHSTHYSRDLYIGWAPSRGIGCDDARDNSIRTPLTPILVDDDPDPTGAQAWALFPGLWGQRAPVPSSGPNAPLVHQQWTDPIATMSTWRSSSFTVPIARTFGVSSTDLFCSVTAFSGKALLFKQRNPMLAWIVLAAIIGVIGFLLWRERHLVRQTLSTWRQHIPIFLAIGAATFLVGALFTGLHQLLADDPPLDTVYRWFNTGPGARVSTTMLIGILQQIVMVLVIVPPAIQVMADLFHGEKPGLRRSFVEAYRHLPAIILAFLFMFVVSHFLGILLVTLPLGLFLLVSWVFFPQALIYDHVRGPMESLEESRQRVKGNWWQALGATVVPVMLGVLPGPLVGVLLMGFGEETVAWANLISGIIYAVTIPLAAIGMSLFYERLITQQEAAQPAPTPTEPGAALPAPAGAKT